MSTSRLHVQQIASLGALALFCILLWGSTDTERGTKEVKAQATEFTLSADQLASAYEANEVAADTKYKGHVVVVTGKVNDIGKDIVDTAYVTIGGSGFLDGVQCMFATGEQSRVAALSKGQFITVKGKVDGKMGNVLMRNCSLR